MSKFVDTLADVAEKVGDALNGPIIPAIVEIGKSVVDLIDNAREVVDEPDVAKLQAMRDELEPKVMAHADQTEKTLRGE